MNICMDTWNAYHGSSMTMAQIGAELGISSRTVLDRLNAVKEVMSSE